MFARVQTFNRPVEELHGLTDEANEENAGGLLPPGFKGALCLIDREHRKALLTSL